MGHWNGAQAGDACPASRCSHLPPSGRFWIPRKGSVTSLRLNSCQQNACLSLPHLLCGCPSSPSLRACRQCVLTLGKGTPPGRRGFF